MTPTWYLVDGFKSGSDPDPITGIFLDPDPTLSKTEVHHNAHELTINKIQHTVVLIIPKDLHNPSVEPLATVSVHGPKRLPPSAALTLNV
uniref:Uncharacterized protein n=1 Tax=Romanomermis culicivorax TaxID=13658 RepID=A0A915K097_ROMCU